MSRRPTTVDLSMPAKAAIKGGWHMFWLGVWCWLRRKDIDMRMGWE